jgi:hypothetical protein
LVNDDLSAIRVVLLPSPPPESANESGTHHSPIINESNITNHHSQIGGRYRSSIDAQAIVAPRGGS